MFVKIAKMPSSGKVRQVDGSAKMCKGVDQARPTWARGVGIALYASMTSAANVHTKKRHRWAIGIRHKKVDMNSMVLW
jgi:hypothetical protein